jgi:hypothetical protein
LIFQIPLRPSTHPKFKATPSCGQGLQEQFDTPSDRNPAQQQGIDSKRAAIGLLAAIASAFAFNVSPERATPSTFNSCR